jgi:peptidoglycan/LPS O-acetylase OafA/YrhL
LNKFRKDINFLRSVSVLSVLFYHAEFKFFNNGYLGVDVFFVISGYLIGSIILDNLAKNLFSFSEFYLKRIRRLAPALYFTLLFSSLIAYAMYSPEDILDFENSAIFSIFFGSNFYFWKSINYFSPEIDIRLLSHTWSLGIEEQFYFLLPVGLYFLFKSRIREKLILVIISMVSVLSFGLVVQDIILSSSSKFYLLPTRLWELLLGVILALLLRNYKIKQRKYLSYFFLFTLLCCLFVFNLKIEHPGSYTLIPVLATFFFILLNDDKFLKTIIDNKIFQTLGAASYSIYLIHFPVFGIERYIGVSSLFEINPIFMELFLILTSLVFGYFMWKYLEHYTRNPEKMSNSTLLKTFIGLTVFFTIFLSTNFLSNLSAKNLQNIEIQKNSNELVDICSVQKDLLLQIEICSESYSDKKINYLVVGDSVAENIYWGIKNNLQDNQTVSLLSVTGCIPLVTDFEYKSPIYNESKCEKNYKLVKNHISLKNYDYIFIQYDYTKFDYFDNEIKIFKNSKKQFLNEIKNIPNVVILGQPVKWSIPVKNALFLESKFGYNFSKHTEISEHFNNLMKAEAENRNIIYISHFDYFCNSGVCKSSEQVDNVKKSLYVDKIHLTRHASSKFGAYIIKSLN